MNSQIERCILEFYARLTADPHHRFRSWGHCYKYFRLIRTGRISLDVDTAALHLGFYLASWGMYRGSFLLWKDYKLHRYAIRGLFRNEYGLLWNLDYARIRDKDSMADLLLDLADRLRHSYEINLPLVNAAKQLSPVTDTLATKILLGTLACTPAYDKFVRKGLHADGIRFSHLNKRNILDLWSFCNDHDEEFRNVQLRIRENGVKYPLMKLVDMYFWTRGQPAAAQPRVVMRPNKFNSLIP